MSDVKKTSQSTATSKVTVVHGKVSAPAHKGVVTPTPARMASIKKATKAAWKS